MPSDLPTHSLAGEDAEPLLGTEGDVSAQQPPSKPVVYNAVTGTAVLAQGGILILVATVWAGILVHLKPLNFFAAHPLLNSSALLFAVEAILLLQPTYTPQQKRTGALLHGSFNLLAFLGFMAAFVVIYVNKGDHPHYTSIHGVLGLVTYLVILAQTAVGFTMYFVPSLYGSVERAKSVWKYHRMSGYAVSVLTLATVCAATQTDYNKTTLRIKLWVVILASVLVLAGVIPRIRLGKLGIVKN